MNPLAPFTFSTSRGEMTATLRPGGHYDLAWRDRHAGDCWTTVGFEADGDFWGADIFNDQDQDTIKEMLLDHLERTRRRASGEISQRGH